MKYISNKSLFFVLFLTIGSFGLFAQGNDQAVLKQVALAIQAGNANELAKHFDGMVEVTLDGSEGKEYSKAQSEQVMKDFFSKNPPTSFKFMHNGESGGNTMFGIGTMESSKGNFRVNIYFKKDGSKYLIYKLKFYND